MSQQDKYFLAAFIILLSITFGNLLQSASKYRDLSEQMMVLQDKCDTILQELGS